MKLIYKSCRLPLKHQFAVANSKKAFAENVFIELTYEDNVGYGEAAPSYFYHESTDTIKRFYDQIQPILKNSALDVDSIMDELESNFEGNYAAKAGINIALFDLIGKKYSLPVYNFLKIENKRPLVTSFTIGIDSIDIIKEKVLSALNFPILKIKLGTEFDFDIIKSIRAITDRPLRIDANEGWSKEEAVEKINWLETQNAELIEQPLPAEDIEGTKWVRQRVNLPIFADESFKTSRDFDKLINAFDGINIKLMKCGGITEALNMVRKARKLNLKTMIGCFIESSLGITAAAHISPLFDYLDLDGALLLKTDIFEGAKIEDGHITLPNRPGFGVKPIVL